MPLGRETFELVDKFGGALKNIGNFETGEVGGKLMQVGGFIGKIAFFTVIVSSIGLIYWKLFIQYRDRALVRVVKGGKVVDVKWDNVRDFEDEQGKRKLKFFKLKQAMPFEGTKYAYKYGKKNFYDVWQDDNGQLHPCELTEPDADLMRLIKPIPQSRKVWIMNETKLQAEKILKKDKFKDFIVTAMPIAAMAITFLIAFFAYKYLGTGINNLASQLGQLATAIKGLK